MLLNLKHLALSLVAPLTLFALPAAAEPLEPANIPADSNWVIHFDMDAIQSSTSWSVVDEHLKKNPVAQQKLAELEQLFNARLPKDLHDITLHGAGFDDATNVIQVHANVDRRGLEGLLPMNPSYASTPHGKYSVLRWDDKGKIIYGAFAKDDRMIVSQSKARVEAALDVLDKKAEAMKTGSTLAQGAKPGVLVYVAGDGLGRLKQLGQVRSPILSQMQSAWGALSEVNQDILIQLQVMADTAETAQKMKKSVEGMLAMVTLAAGEPDAKPGLKLLGTLVDNVQTTTEQTAVKLEWRMPLARIKELVPLALQARDEAESKR